MKSTAALRFHGFWRLVSGATSAQALSASRGYVAYTDTSSADESDSRLIQHPVNRDGEIVWQRII